MFFKMLTVGGKHGEGEQDGAVVREGENRASKMS